MRWNKSKLPPLKNGDTKTKVKFLWMPWCLNGEETRWLECANVLYTYRSSQASIDMDMGHEWVATRFFDESPPTNKESISTFLGDCVIIISIVYFSLSVLGFLLS